MADNKTPASNQAAAKSASESTTEGIECSVIKTFYDEDMRLTTPGASYVYLPKDDQPFPWNILRPKDEAYHKEAKKSYDDFKAKKQEKLDEERKLRENFRRMID